MGYVLKNNKQFNKPKMSSVDFLSADFLVYSMELESMVNNFDIHKGQAPFHTMGKGQYFLSDDEYVVLQNVNREWDGVEDDLIFYERWLVNCDRIDKKRRNIFR